MQQLIYYSLCMMQNADDLFRLSQLMLSLRSLRRHNRQIPVMLFITGELDKMFVFYLVQEFNLVPVMCGPYVSMLNSVLPDVARYLTQYPILHKFLVLKVINELKPQQVLYVDTDTVFFNDPAQLFNSCRQHDIYARLEFYTSPQEQELKPGYFDTQQYADLAADLGSQLIQPFNTGVMLLNQGSWQHFWAESSRFLEYVLRFNPLAERPASGEIPGYPPLPYPSENPWIRDQVAFWLVMGRKADYSFGELNYQQVLMGAEEIDSPGRFSPPVISHYFGSNTDRYFAGLANKPFKSR